MFLFGFGFVAVCLVTLAAAGCASQKTASAGKTAPWNYADRGLWMAVA